MVEDEETPAVTIPENTPGVRVLTMHQSKGLEFPAVIVPVNDSGGRSDDNLHWDREGLFHINGDLAQAHPGLKEKYRKENIRGSIDLLNLLYVAFTRAKEALFVPVSARQGTGRRPQAKRRPDQEDRQGQRCRRPPPAAGLVRRRAARAFIRRRRSSEKKGKAGGASTLAALAVPRKKC